MKKFAIASLALAGFLPADADSSVTSLEPNLENDENNFASILDRVLPFTLAGHSSHRSHGSHRSHRSSGGGGTAVPRANPPSPVVPNTPPSTNRNQNSTPPSSILPNSPALNLPKIKGNSAHFKRIVERIQMMLFAFGFYSGNVDGIVNTETAIAIAKYQNENGLPITGAVDETLIKRLGISVD